MYDIATEKVVNEDKSIYGAIDFMMDEMRRRQYLTLILTDVPDLSTDNAEAQQMLALVNLANESGGVIIVMTSNPIWTQLQRQGLIVRIDNPDEEEMVAIISEYMNDYRHEIPIEWDNGDIREAASILSGVTSIEAENVIAALIANKCVRKSQFVHIDNAGVVPRSSLSFSTFPETGHFLSFRRYCQPFRTVLPVFPNGIACLSERYYLSSRTAFSRSVGSVTLPARGFKWLLFEDKELNYAAWMAPPR